MLCNHSHLTYCCISYLDSWALRDQKCWHSMLIKRSPGSHEAERAICANYGLSSVLPRAPFTDESFFSSFVVLLITSPLLPSSPSPSHVTSVNRRDDASGQNKAKCRLLQQRLFIPELAQELASEDTTPFPLSLSGASRCFGALHRSSKHPRNSPSPLLIRVRSLNCMLAYIRRQLASFLSL